LIIPDLVGLTVKEAAQVLLEAFPKISYEFRTYHSPISKNEKDTINVAYLVIRQRTIEDNNLELIISPFPRMNE
jgi:hypothetical protein